MSGDGFSYIFVLGTAAIAVYTLFIYRTEEGRRSPGGIVLGILALLYSIYGLLADILDVI